MSFAEAAQNLKKAFENFGYVLTFSLIPAMRKEYIQITNYNCPTCGNILGIYSHNNYEIIYQWHMLSVLKLRLIEVLYD